VWRLRRLVRARRFQLVHTHSPVPAVAARLLLGPRPPALVHTEHNVWRRYHRATYLANALSYSRNAAVIAVSQAVARSVKAPRILPRLRLPPVETVLHGIDGAAAPNGPAARAHGRSLLGLHDADPVLGTVGNFTPKKDHAGLFDAFARVLARFPAARLVLVGSGPLERELRQRVHRDGLDGHVTFTGIRDDVAQLLPAFDVFVLSSRHEGLSLALLEAMAAGVPCVATRVGGVPEALGDGRAGVLVPFGDSSALAEELARLLDAPELRRSLGAAGRSHALAAFGIERAVRRTGEIYAAVLASR
jgi:glycosyltransferase involved in cell wall biosynthesis